MKKLSALAVLALVLLTQRPLAQGSGLRIFFVDIGQGAGTLIVGPPDGTGKVTSLLVDGGPPGGGTAKIIPLLDALGIAKVDYTVVTHYHIDHISGITELLAAGRVGAIAFDNGDAPELTPPNPGGTRSAYLAYIAAATAAGIPRQQIQPGQTLSLGPGVRATCIAAGGRLISRGVVPITNEDLNSESIAMLVEYNGFDYLVAGDLTGGGSTSTAKTPDVETYVGQVVGDLDVVQLNHHGSTTTSNQTFLARVKAEVAVAQASDDNTFGHPHREVVNKYLNTPVTNGNSHALPNVPVPGSGPVFYQPESPVNGDDRVTLQGIAAAGPGAGGNGTLLLQTDGTTTYSLRSVDDGGIRVDPVVHSYPVDGVSPGATTNFPPTVQVETTPTLPLATDAVTVKAAIIDRETVTISSAVVNWSLNGVAQAPIAMSFDGTSFLATIPAQPDGTRVDYSVAGTSNAAPVGVQTTTFSGGYFSGTTPVSSLQALTPKGEPLYTGYVARIQGTVTASGFSGGGTNDDYVQDPTGAVNVYKSTDGPTVFTSTAPGQLVEARGRINFNGGRLRLDLTESIEKTASPFGVAIRSTGPAPSPVATTIAAIAANPESFEGQFVSIANASITSGTIPPTPQAIDSFVTISDGTGSFSMKIDDDTDVEGFTPAATFTAIGIIQQDDFLRPFDGGYNITPRSRVDLGAGGPSEAPLLTIAEARADAVNNTTLNPPADLVPDRVGQVVKVRGAITSVDLRGGNGIEYYVQDPTGGIDLFSTTLNAGPFAYGDNVEATGTVTHFNGLTELVVTSVTAVSPGGALVPEVVTLAQLGNAGAGEAFEGRLVRVDNVTLTNPGPLFPANDNLTIADATGTATLRIDADTDIDGTPTPTGPFSVTGVVGQFDNAAPFDSSYQLFPRTVADIAGSVCPAIAVDGALPGGATGAPYSQTLSASGGTPPYQFSVSAGALPDGLNLSAAGVVSGTPTVAGSFTFTVGAVGADTCAGAASFTVVIAGAPGGGGGIVISEFRTRGAVGGNDEFVEIYNNSDAAIDISGYRLQGSNSAGTTSTRSTVPFGVILPPREHYLFVNTPATTGYSLAVPGNRGFTTGITDDGGVAILDATSATPLDAVGMSAGSAFKEGTTLAPVTTNGNRSYERKPGSPAVTLQDTGDNTADFQLLGGVPPNVPNPQNVVLTAAPASIDFDAVVVPGTQVQVVTFKNVLLPAVSITLDTPVITGTDAGEFSVTAPAVTTLAGGSETTAMVTFQPTAAGSKSASLVITSTNSGTRAVALSGLAACPAISVAGTLPAGEFGFAYSQTFSASGGSGPYTFRVSAGALPAGLSLDPGGVLSGTPAALGAYTFTVEAEAATGCTGTADFTLTILDTTPPVLTLPGDLTATATSPAGAVVSFTASALDLADGVRPVTCVPASGSTFAIGSTTVACAASDTRGNQSNGAFQVVVTEPAQAGRMLGSGRIETGGTRHEFDFVVQERTGGADAGALRYRVRAHRRGRDQEDRFDAIATRAVFFDLDDVSPGPRPSSGVDTVLFTGVGRWNGVAGYTFEARATDADRRGRDRFAITIRDAAGRIVATVDDRLDNGNIESIRIGR